MSVHKFPNPIAPPKEVPIGEKLEKLFGIKASMFYSPLAGPDKYTLNFSSVNIPTNSGGASVVVEEDSNSDGVVENSDTISLSDGVTSYETSAVFDGRGQIRLSFTLGPPSDVTVTSSITAPVEGTDLPKYTSTEFDNSNSESGVVHQSVANTDNNNSSVLKQGYDYANFSEISPTPVACWPLHENSGSTVYDVAGSYNGTYSGATLGQTGILGASAVSFDGTDDYANLGDNSTLTPTNSLTTTFWFKTSEAADAFKSISRHNNHFTPLQLNNASEGQAVPFINGSTYETMFPWNYGDGAWHFYAVTFDQSNGTRVFVDTTEVASNSQTGSLDTNSSNWYLGGAQDAGAEYTNVDIFDFRLYGGVSLSSSQIQTLYDVVASQGSLTTPYKAV